MVMLQFSKQQVISSHPKTWCWQHNFNHQHKYRISISCKKWCYHVMNHASCSDKIHLLRKHKSQQFWAIGLNKKPPIQPRVDYSTLPLDFTNMTLPATNSSPTEKKWHPKRNVLFELPWFLGVYVIFHYLSGGVHHHLFLPFSCLHKTNLSIHRQNPRGHSSQEIPGVIAVFRWNKPTFSSAQSSSAAYLGIPKLVEIELHHLIGFIGKENPCFVSVSSSVLYVLRGVGCLPFIHYKISTPRIDRN